MNMSEEMKAARQAMIDKRFGGNAKGASTGGAGSQRMKAKGAHKSGGGKCLCYVLTYTCGLVVVVKSVDVDVDEDGDIYAMR